MFPLGQAVLKHILHGSSESPSRMEPQSLSAKTSTSTVFCMFFFFLLYNTLHNSLLCFPRINYKNKLFTCNLLSWAFFPQGSSVRQYPFPGLKPNEEYIYTFNPRFFILAANLVLLHCDSELLSFYFS